MCKKFMVKIIMMMKTIYKRKKGPWLTLWGKEPPRMLLSSFLLGIYCWASSLLLYLRKTPLEKRRLYLQVVINWGQLLCSWWEHVSTFPSNSSIPSVTDCVRLVSVSVSLYRTDSAVCRGSSVLSDSYTLSLLFYMGFPETWVGRILWRNHT